MMMSIVPSDMALSPKGSRRFKKRLAARIKAHFGPRVLARLKSEVVIKRRLDNETPRDLLLVARGHETRSGLSNLFRLQLQRCRIDAVAQAGRAGAVIEDMAEMAVAFRAQHLGADHAVADVALLVDMAVQRGRGKARPAAAGIELGVGFEQRLAAAGAGIGALAMLMLIFAGEGPLGRLLAQHRVLHRRQLLAPIGLALDDL